MNINDTWKHKLQTEMSKDYFKAMTSFLNVQYDTKKIYPPKNLIFNAFNLTNFEDVKVVILGQDPYINENQANGLAFSVNDGCKIPPSLRNIYKELKDSLCVDNFHTGDLTPIASQGVLFLNTSLTVEAGNPNSHSRIGWETFTDHVIKTLSMREKPLVFLLWGNNAKKKEKFISNHHKILTASHPSPLSARHSFFGCNHFNLTNIFLISINSDIIDWQL